MAWYWIAGIVLVGIAIERTGSIYWRKKIYTKRGDEESEMEAHARRVKAELAGKFTGDRR